MNRLWVVILILFAVEVGLAGTGRIQVRDGAVFTGELSIDPGLGFVITNSEIGLTNFAISDVAIAQFSVPAELEPTTATNSSALPKGWTNMDIGPFTKTGGVRVENGVYTLSSSGTAIWLPQPDEFQFMYRAFNGNGQFIVQVTNAEATLSGIMFRRTLDPNSEFVLVGFAPMQTSVTFRSRRDVRQRESTHMPGDWVNREAEGTSQWFRISRRDKRLAAYRSSDEGLTWDAIQICPMDWDRQVYAGLFVVGGATNQLKQASFTNLLVEDETDTLATSTNKLFKAQVTLNSGTVLNADKASGDATRVRIGFAGTNYLVSIYSVARIGFGVVPEKLKRELTSGRRGVLLKSGDFFEGELRSMDQNQVKMSSVLFGARTFQTDRVLVVILSETKETPAVLQVSTRNGSVIRAGRVEFANNALVVEEERLGRIALPLDQLNELTNNSLKPRRQASAR